MKAELGQGSEPPKELAGGDGDKPGMTREVVLAARPQGEPKESDFELRDADGARAGRRARSLVRNVFVSVDPYMRSRMTGIRTYVGPYEVGEVDRRRSGRPRRRVAATPASTEGDWVISQLGWCERGVVDGDRAAQARSRRSRRRRPRSACSACRASLPGSASSTSAQVAGGRDDLRLGRRGRRRQRRGADREAEGPARDRQRRLAEKVEWLRSLGVEAFDYRETPAKEALADGIDVYFDNVGGDAARGCALRAASVRPRDRLRRDLALQRRAPRAGPRNLPHRHEAAAHAGVHRLRPQRPLRDVPARGRPVGRERASSSAARRSSRGSRTCRPRSRALPRRQHRQDARPRRA